MPIVATTEKKLNAAPSNENWTSITGGLGVAAMASSSAAATPGIDRETLHPRCRIRVKNTADCLAARALEQSGSDRRPVQHRIAHRPGFDHQIQDVGGLGQSVRRAEPAEQALRAAIRPEHVPGPIHQHGRERLMLREHRGHRDLHALELRRVEPSDRIQGGVAGSQQDCVALAKWNLERLGKADDHLAARLRAACLDEADVPGRRRGRQRQIELALATKAWRVPLDPFLEPRAWSRAGTG